MFSQQQEDEEMLVPGSDLVDGPAQPMEGKTFFDLIQFDPLLKFLVSVCFLCDGMDEIELMVLWI